MKYYLLACLLMSSLCAVAQVNLNLGLVLYLPFNGNTLDASGNGNNATNFGATLTTDQWGNPNSAYLFNGTSNYMEVANSATINFTNGIYSVYALVKPQGFYNGLCHGNDIIDKGDNDFILGWYTLRFSDAYSTSFQNCSSPLNTTQQNFYPQQNNLNFSGSGYLPYIVPNTWYCLVVISDGIDLKLYLDGILVSTQTINALIGTNTDNLFIGRKNSTTYPYWYNGVLDELRIYNRALNLQEIDSLCNLNQSAANLNINASSTTVCLGQPVTLTATGLISYNWSGGISNGVPFTPNSTATYIVTGQAANGNTYSDSVVVIVNLLPTVSCSSIPSNGILCAGQALVLSGQGASTYTWSNGVINNTSFSPMNSNVYTVTGTDANGCSATSSISITINPKPAVTAIANPATVCIGKPTQLTATGASTYTWSGGVSNSVPFIPPTTNSYTVVGTDANGCTATSSIVVDVVQFLNISVLPSSPFLCAGDSVWLTASGANYYSWSPSNGLSNSNSANVWAYPNTSITYYITGTDASGCTGTTSVPINVVDQVHLTVSKTNDIECGHPTVELSATGATSYTWSPASALSNPSNANTQATINQTTTFIVTGTVGSCSATDSITVNYFNNDEKYIFIPSAFSPNNDGKNDCLRIVQNANFKQYYFCIYNRWGERVFESDNPTDCWNGEVRNQAAAMDTYNYYLKAETACGKIFKKGDIILVR